MKAPSTQLKEVAYIISRYARDSMDQAKANLEWSKRLNKIAEAYSKEESKKSKAKDKV